METAAIITALVGAFTAASAAVWKLIDRSDKKREQREVKVEELLKARIEALEKAVSDRDKLLKEQRRYTSRVKATAGKWREQLIVNNIEPDPAEWPEEHPHE